MHIFTARVIELIRRIPPGSVSTYGLIAAAAGNKNGARQVARILHSSSAKYELPWHRVINGQGTISPRSSMSHISQRRRLETEGICFNRQDKIDLAKYLWLP